MYIFLSYLFSVHFSIMLYREVSTARNEQSATASFSAFFPQACRNVDVSNTTSPHNERLQSLISEVKYTAKAYDTCSSLARSALLKLKVLCAVPSSSCCSGLSSTTMAIAGSSVLLPPAPG